jgi:hypothetical protein
MSIELLAMYKLRAIEIAQSYFPGEFDKMLQKAEEIFIKITSL